MDKINLKNITSLLLMLGVLVLAGCAMPVSTEDIVRVEEVHGVQQVDGIKSSELEMISRLRQNSGRQGFIPAVENISSGTLQLTVEEYLGRFYDPADHGEADYTVGGNDVLTIFVYDEPDLSRSGMRVARDGTISFPLLGRLQVGGLVVSQVEELISRRLAEKQLLLDAQVTVMVQDYGSKRYQVLGEIRKPGSYPLKANERLLDVISEAGGVDPETAGKEVMIVRTIQPVQTAELSEKSTKSTWGETPSFGADYRAAEPVKVVISVDLDRLLRGNDLISNLILHDNDVIYLPKAEFFYIMGQVKSPGSYKFTRKNLTLVGAIGTAGGFTNIAGRRKTRIIRVENGVEKIITVNVDAITSAGRKIHDVPIKPDDIIIVPESFF
jgi:polysaccharide export outer membrane protein